MAAAAGLSALTDEKPRSLDLQSGVIVAHVPADYKSRRNIKDSRAETQKHAAAESACRQYRVARWFLLPEVGLRPRLGIKAAADSKSAATGTDELQIRHCEVIAN